MTILSHSHHSNNNMKTMKTLAILITLFVCISLRAQNEDPVAVSKMSPFEVVESADGIGFKHSGSLFGGSATVEPNGDLHVGMMAGLEKSVRIERYADAKRDVLWLSLDNAEGSRELVDLDFDGQWDFEVNTTPAKLKGRKTEKFVLIKGKRLDVRRLSLTTPQVYCEDMTGKTLIFGGGRWTPGEPSKR